MLINPTSKSLTYPIDVIADVEVALNSIEQSVLNDENIKGVLARLICGELNQVRDSLSLKRGVQRHDKSKQEQSVKAGAA